MKFLVDEDVAMEVTHCLRQAGHEVLRVGETLDFKRTTWTSGITRFVLRRSLLRAIGRTSCNWQGLAPETGLIVLNRRRTREAECRKILKLLSDAGEGGLRNNINFA